MYYNSLVCKIVIVLWTHDMGQKCNRSANCSSATRCKMAMLDAFKTVAICKELMLQKWLVKMLTYCPNILCQACTRCDIWPLFWHDWGSRQANHASHLCPQFNNNQLTWHQKCATLAGKFKCSKLFEHQKLFIKMRT